MTSPFDEHFDEVRDEQTHSFPLSNVVPTSTGTDQVAAVVKLMARNKSDPDVTSDLLAAAGWTVAVAPLRKGRVPVRRGDFGEVLAVEASDALDGLFIPVRKLRYQIDSNQTLPGSDVVGFELADDGTLVDLDFIESKYRTNPASDIAVEAHEQLAHDRDEGYATTLNFLAHRLKELDLRLYHEFLRFLHGRGAKDSRNTVVVLADTANWKDIIVSNLNDLPDHLPRLQLRCFKVPDASQLIDAVYDQLSWMPVEDE